MTDADSPNYFTFTPSEFEDEFALEIIFWLKYCERCGVISAPPIGESSLRRSGRDSNGLKQLIEILQGNLTGEQVQLRHGRA